MQCGWVLWLWVSHEAAVKGTPGLCHLKACLEKDLCQSSCTCLLEGVSSWQTVGGRLPSALPRGALCKAAHSGAAEAASEWEREGGREGAGDRDRAGKSPSFVA